jgi:thiol-disulfide isomerase/thioredoxin
MKKITINIVLALLCLNFYASAQSNTPAKNLQTGDKMPPTQVVNILNYNKKNVNLSDYKGKLILLDFWSTWCSSCIDGFPELDSLQRQFPDKLQVFLVNSKKEGDTERGVKIVISRMNAWSGQPFKLPVVLRDTAITRNFVFHSLPHCVWINQDGTIIAITEKDQVTRENIAKVIAGKPVNLKPKSH